MNREGGGGSGKALTKFSECNYICILDVLPPKRGLEMVQSSLAIREYIRVYPESLVGKVPMTNGDV